MWIIFKILRFMRHMERRVVGVHPSHWASDFVKIGGIPVKLIKEVVERIHPSKATLFTDLIAC
jgi:hypothetical protein